MADFPPTEFPSTSYVEKLVNISPLERVDYTDFVQLSRLNQAGRAHSNYLLTASGSYILRGLRVQSMLTYAPPNPDIMLVWVTPGRALIDGYITKVPLAVGCNVPNNTTGAPRTDTVAVRYIDTSGTNAAKSFLNAITDTAVVGEAVGTGDGATTTFDLDHSGVKDETLIVYSAGTKIAYSISPGTGGAGVDQIVCALPPAASAAVTADYTWRTGGTEGVQATDTRYLASYEVYYFVGPAVPPPAEHWFTLATVTVPHGAVAVTQAMIAWYGDDAANHPFLFGEVSGGFNASLETVQYKRFEAGIEVRVGGGATLAAHVLTRGPGIIINNTWMDVNAGGAPFPIHVDTELEYGLALVPSTWYFCYACVLRSLTASPSLVWLFSPTVPTPQRLTATANLAYGPGVNIQAADTLYIGAVWYTAGAQILEYRRETGRVLYFSEQSIVAAHNLPDFAGAWETRNLRTPGYVPETATAGIVRAEAELDIGIAEAGYQQAFLLMTPAGGVHAFPTLSLKCSGYGTGGSHAVAQCNGVITEIPFVDGSFQIIDWAKSGHALLGTLSVMGYGEPLP